MIAHIPTKQLFNTRLEAKRALGGVIAYNEAHKNKELLFINSKKDFEEYIKQTK